MWRFYFYFAFLLDFYNNSRPETDCRTDQKRSSWRPTRHHRSAGTKPPPFTDPPTILTRFGSLEFICRQQWTPGLWRMIQTAIRSRKPARKGKEIVSLPRARRTILAMAFAFPSLLTTSGYCCRRRSRAGKRGRGRQDSEREQLPFRAQKGMLPPIHFLRVAPFLLSSPELSDVSLQDAFAAIMMMICLRNR